MNGPELLRIVDSMHRDKAIPKEVIFDGIEAALLLAARKHYNEAEDITISIDRDTGFITAKKGEVFIDPQVLGRIAAQSAKQVMIQKIREAECNSVYEDFTTKQGTLIVGTVQRIENGSALVSLGKSEAFMPRSEMIPGETFHVGQRVKAIILEVRKMGSRVRIVLSRTHPDFVRRLFEMEIPEVADRTLSIRSVAREAGYRTKIAVSSIDQKVDAVGACVGVRGSRIKNIGDELGGERIDIVRWNESLQVMIPNALQPAAVEEVMLYPRLGRAIVLVNEDQLSLAIGRRGQNVRLASKLVGWDIEIMTADELNETVSRADAWFKYLVEQFPGLPEDLPETFITEGYLSYEDLTFMETDEMAEVAGIDEELAEKVIAFAEAMNEEIEKAKAQEAAEARDTAAAQAALLDNLTPSAEDDAKASAASSESSDAAAPPSETAPTAEPAGEEQKPPPSVEPS
jgi:N utilization substance protein A